MANWKWGLWSEIAFSMSWWSTVDQQLQEIRVFFSCPEQCWMVYCLRLLDVYSESGITARQLIPDRTISLSYTLGAIKDNVCIWLCLDCLWVCNTLLKHLHHYTGCKVCSKGLLFQNWIRLHICVYVNIFPGFSVSAACYVLLQTKADTWKHPQMNSGIRWSCNVSQWVR